MISLKKPTTTLTAAALALAVSGTASALPFFPSAGTTPGTQFEDNNIEFFVDNDGDGRISVGDELWAVAEFGAARDILPPIEPVIPLNTAADELVAVSKIKVQAIVDPVIAGDPVLSALYPDVVASDAHSAIRLPHIDFGPNGSDPMVAVYSMGGTADLDLGTYSVCSDWMSCLNAVTDGNLLATFSIVDPDDEWFFVPSVPMVGALDPAGIAGLSQTTKVGTANFALSQVGGPFDVKPLQLDCAPFGVFVCAGDGLTDLVGSGDILGGAGLTVGGADLDGDGIPDVSPAFAVSDFDVSVIPEPGVLALVGMGLLGAGLARRRRRG